MKTIIVVSDTHGSQSGLKKIAPLIAENNYFIHLGDGAGDVRTIRAEYPDKVYACAGNCDFISPLPNDGILEVEQVRIYFCHGHKYSVKSHLYALAKTAKERGCDVALYGHTHNADVCEVDGVLCINPGSLRRAAGEGGSYCYLVINKEKITPTIVGDRYYS